MGTQGEGVTVLKSAADSSVEIVAGPWKLQISLHNEKDVVISANLTAQLSKASQPPTCVLQIKPHQNSSESSKCTPSSSPLNLFSLLPPEITTHITSFLPRKSLLCLSSVNHQWNELCDSQSIWKKRFIDNYGVWPLFEMSWKQRFQFLHRQRFFQPGYNFDEHNCLANVAGSSKIYKRFSATYELIADRNISYVAFNWCCRLGNMKLPKHSSPYKPNKIAKKTSKYVQARLFKRSLTTVPEINSRHHFIMQRKEDSWKSSNGSSLLFRTSSM